MSYGVRAMEFLLFSCYYVNIYFRFILWLDGIPLEIKIANISKFLYKSKVIIFVFTIIFLFTVTIFYIPRIIK